jgi:acyl-CoA thioesterase
MSADIRNLIKDSLDALEDWQLEAMARLTQMDWRRRFGNPSHILGLPLYDREGARMVAELELSELHLNPNGVCHGMVAFGLLDNAMGTSVSRSADPQLNTSTIEIKVQFVRPVQRGTTIRIEAEPVRIGKRLAHVTARMIDDEGVAVMATGTYSILE